MATTLKSIMGELDKYYSPSTNLLNQQLAAIPKSTAAAEAGLNAKLAQANTNILDSARSRGVGFSGIPIQEQAQYAATDYAPALANLKAGAEQNRLGILESLNQLGRDRRSQAQSIYDTSRNFAEQQRQFNLNYKLQQQQAADARRAAVQQQANADYYLNLDRQNQQNVQNQQKKQQNLAAQQNVYSRAKSLQKIWQMGDPGAFNAAVRNLLKQGDDASKNTIVTAYKLIGMPKAEALKKWGLI
jgi:hypothetical protein